MIERVPPRLALWILKHWGSAYHSESLQGDLMEQFQEGRSRAWYWKQVAAAIVIAQGRFIRAMPWTAAARVLARCLAEVGTLLAVLAIADRSRRAHSIADMMSRTFVCTLIVLIAVALIGVLASIRTGRRKQGHALISTLMLAFGVIALGVGTLTWADSARGDACRTAACVCTNN